VVHLSVFESIAQRVERGDVGGEMQDVAVLADRTRVPRRVIATSQNTPGSLSAASFLPAQLDGIG
jgi:hypothetical protein